MKIAEEHVGTCIAYGSWTDAPVVRITSVSRTGMNPGISVESTDGYGDGWYPSMWRTLDQITEDWRPATEEETANFLRIYQDRTTPNYY